MSASDWQRGKQQRYTRAGSWTLPCVKLEIYQSFDLSKRILGNPTSNEKDRSFQHASQSWRAFDIILFDSLSHSCARLVADFKATNVSTGLFPKYPKCRVSGTTRKPRRNEFVPKLSSKQNVEYLTHATLQWTTDDTKNYFWQQFISCQQETSHCDVLIPKLPFPKQRGVLQLKNRQIHAVNKLLNFNFLVAFDDN